MWRKPAVKPAFKPPGPEPAGHRNLSTNHRQSQAAKAAVLCAPVEQSCRGTTGFMSDQSVKLNMLLLLAFLLLSYGAGNARCSTVHANITDILSLLRFKRSTHDPTGSLRNWNRSIHYCKWNGVSCSLLNPGRVAALDLPGQNLSGQVNPSLGNITFLKRADAS